MVVCRTSWGNRENRLGGAGVRLASPFITSASMNLNGSLLGTRANKWECSATRSAFLVKAGQGSEDGLVGGLDGWFGEAIRQVATEGAIVGRPS